MKNKIKNILGALALTTALGATQAQASKFKAQISAPPMPKESIETIFENIDDCYQRTGKLVPYYANQKAYTDLGRNIGLLHDFYSNLPNDSSEPIDWSSEKQAWYAALDAYERLGKTIDPETDELFVYGSLGGALDFLFQARLKNPAIASYEDILFENTKLAERIGNLAARADSLSQELSRRARSNLTNLVENEQISEPELSYVPIDSIMAAREIHPALEDSCYEETQTVPARTQEPIIVTYKRPGRNPLSATVYSAPGAGLNLDLGRLNLGFAVVRPHVNREQNLETRVTTNEPAPDFRTVYTEDISTEEGTYGAAYLGTLGYDLGGFSLLTGAELVNRERSGKQRNTIRHYIDNTQISEVSENVVLDEKETKKVYPVFGGMIPITDGTKIIGLYSTAGEYMVGLNFKLGGK